MKCPYQTKVIHKSEYIEGYAKNFAEDITEFGECVKIECPFYYTSCVYYTLWQYQIVEHCLKAEREIKNETNN